MNEIINYLGYIIFSFAGAIGIMKYAPDLLERQKWIPCKTITEKIAIFRGIYAFIFSYMFCIDHYPYLEGVGFGWAPSIVIGLFCLTSWAGTIIVGVIILGHATLALGHTAPF